MEINLREMYSVALRDKLQSKNQQVMRRLVDISKLYDYSNNRLFLPIIPWHGRVVGNYRQTRPPRLARLWP